MTARRIPPGAGQQELDGMPVPPPPPAPPRPRMDDYDEWAEKAHDVFLEAAATRSGPFTFYGVANDARLPDPPNPDKECGRFMTGLRAEGIVTRDSWTSSERPTGGHSGVRTWRGTRKAKRVWAELCAAREADAA